jgi:ADP-heptose:LPS heptosyltransferase
VILFPGALGDLVLAADALAALRTRHVDAHLTLAVGGALRGLAATSGLADATASLDDADAVGLFGGTRIPAWFGERPTLYAWIGSRDAAVAAHLRTLTERSELFPIVRDDGDEHAALVYVRQIGAREPPCFRWPAVPSTPRVDALLDVGARAVLVLHAGAGSRTKRWAPGGFARLAERWQAAGGALVELVGPADGDVPPIAGARRIVAWPLTEVAALLARVDAYAGNDSGVSHLAGAVGARGVAVFGPTAARRWAPRGGSIEALQAITPGADGITTDALAVARVWDALRRRGCLDKLRTRE